MSTLIFRGNRYESKVLTVEKPRATLTYRRATYQARQRRISVEQELCLPDGFIRSRRTAELIGLPLQPCSTKYLTYRGVSYIKSVE